jgi:DNA topoisomerase-3
MIAVLRQRPRGAVNLQIVPAAKTTAGKKRARKTQRPAKADSSAETTRQAVSAKPRTSNTSKGADTGGMSTETIRATPKQTPTERMVSYAQKLAKMKGIALPLDCNRDFQACRRFLDEHG